MDKEYTDVEETEWYKKMQAEATPGSALSEKSGVPEAHLPEMENGKRPIGEKMALKLSKALECDYRSLL